MNRIVAGILVAAGVLLAMELGATTAVSKPTEAAAAESGQWLRLVDEGKYGESWAAMAPSFRDEVRKSKWEGTIHTIRKSLGRVISRKLKSAEYTKELAGAPEGEYVVLNYNTDFERKTGTVETVTTILSLDLVWNVTGYSVK